MAEKREGMIDREVLWTWERMMEKTEKYCVYGTHECVDDKTGLDIMVTGWWVTAQVKDDVLARLECLN